MGSPGAPDGIVSGSGSGAVALIAAIEASGRVIGRDIDMVSKESQTLLQWLRPEVITMREDIRLAGQELAKAVIASIEGRPAAELQTLSYPIPTD